MKEAITKQLKLTSSAIDLIKMSQRSQHTSIKEALRKMLKCISMIAETSEKPDLIVDIERELTNKIDKIDKHMALVKETDGTEQKKLTKPKDVNDLIKQAEKIAERSKTNETNKTKS